MGKDGKDRRRKKPPGKGGMHKPQRGEGTRTDAENLAFFSFEGSLDESRFHEPFENTKTDFFADESRAFNLPPAQAPRPAPTPEPAPEPVAEPEAADAPDPETIGEIAPATFEGTDETIGEIASADEPAPETVGELAPAAPETIGEIAPATSDAAHETIGEIAPEAFDEPPETVDKVVVPGPDEEAPAAPAPEEGAPVGRPAHVAEDEAFPDDPGTIGEFEDGELPDDTVADLAEPVGPETSPEADAFADLRDAFAPDGTLDTGDPAFDDLYAPDGADPDPGPPCEQETVTLPPGAVEGAPEADTTPRGGAPGTRTSDLSDDTAAESAAFAHPPVAEPAETDLDGTAPAPDAGDETAGASPAARDVPSETIADAGSYERLREPEEEAPETAGDLEAFERTETFDGTSPPTDIPSETVADGGAYERLFAPPEPLTEPFGGPDAGTDTQPHPEALPADPDRTATFDGPSPAATPSHLEDTADFTPPDTKPAAPRSQVDTASMDDPQEAARGPREAHPLDRTLTEVDGAFEGGALPPGAPIEIAPSVPFTEVPIFTEAEPVTDSDTSTRGAAPVPGRGRRRAARRRRPSLVKRALARLDPRPLVKRARVFLEEARTRWRATSKPQRLELEAEKTGEWWRRTMLEIGVLYSIVVPIELAVNGGHLGSVGVYPHPYWLIILPMAGARGVVAGLLSASIGALLYVIGASQAHEGGLAAIFDYKAMTDPILFFAVAFFAGELRDELALRYRKLQRLLEDVQERNARLRRERDVLSEANRELERRIVDDSVQFGNMILAAQRIEKSGRAEVFEVALEMVEEHCRAAASVLMILEDGSLDYLCKRGWPDDETSDRLARARESGFVARAIAEGCPVNGFAPGEAPPEAGPLVVVPLFTTDGVARALLCLDEIAIERLNESTVTVFLGIGEWISSALARLTRAGDTPSQPGSLASTQALPGWLGDAVDLGARLRLEVERCTRYGIPTAFLAIQAPKWRDTSVEGRETIDRYIVTHFTGGLRPSDELFRFGYPGCYLLVLAGTTIEGAEIVRRRLLRRVEYSPSREVGPIEIFASGPNAEAPDLLTLVDSVARRLREASTLPLDQRTPIKTPTGIPLGDVEDFMRRLRMEANLAVRNGFELHVVGITADAAGPGGGALLTRHVRDVGHLRPTDGVYTVGPLQCAVVLPCTNVEEAAVVAHRVVTSVRDRDPDATYGNLETQVLSLGPNHPDAGSLLSALARRSPA